LLVADINNFALFVIDANDPSKAPDVLPPFPEALRGVNFVPQDWSPDGKAIIGYSAPHVWAYSFETREYSERTTNAFFLQWFADSRRFLATREGRVFVVDSMTGQAREAFALPGETINSAQFSSDGWLYFLSGNASGDVWVVRFGD
jgi:hypothetical protein